MINNGLFTGLLLWSSESTAHWNQLVGGAFAVFFISLIIILRGFYLFLGWNFFSSGDERTSKILASSALFMFVTFIICDLVLPHAFMWQIFFLIKYSIVFLIGGSYLLWQHHRDFS
ncbi:DUF2178 domain-containing protein [Companilactobacillus kedongensis]|uniref:DUF2178 domain-containing protein n=1 Tax=Companilactobacillus kedongensis TaxID=2486004 RepID=UPI0013DE2D64|nr:DUF2178 domain-containing protein [Companilactobacillus kedongensis]